MPRTAGFAAGLPADIAMAIATDLKAPGSPPGSAAAGTTDASFDRGAGEADTFVFLSDRTGEESSGAEARAWSAGTSGGGFGGGTGGGWGGWGGGTGGTGGGTGGTDGGTTGGTGGTDGGTTGGTDGGTTGGTGSTGGTDGGTTGGTPGGTTGGSTGGTPDWLTPTIVTIEVDGILRSFGITLPKDFDPAQSYSGVMTFHGGGSVGNDPTTMASLTGFSSFDSPAQFIEIYPLATSEGWAWNPSKPFVDDVRFIEALVDELVANWNLDAGRLFAAGISEGGEMVQRLALDAPELFAGHAVVAANMMGPMLTNSAQQGDEPMIFFAGTEDPAMPYDGIVNRKGVTVMLGAEETAEFWAARNKTSMGAFSDLPDLVDDGMTVSFRLSGDGSIAQYVVEGGGHSWPGSLDGSAQDIDASALMVEFFSQYGLF